MTDNAWCAMPGVLRHICQDHAGTPCEHPVWEAALGPDLAGRVRHDDTDPAVLRDVSTRLRLWIDDGLRRPCIIDYWQLDAHDRRLHATREVMTWVGLAAVLRRRDPHWPWELQTAFAVRGAIY